MEDIEQIKEVLFEHGYEYKQFLGQGGFSSVYLCQSCKYHHDFAIKRTIISKLTKEEYNTLVSLNHPNIIKIYDAFEKDNVLYLVIEYCPNGTIKKNEQLHYDQFVYYARQILNAISYCHSQKIAHRDIKPENIFYDQFENCKLADFGIAKHFNTINDKSDQKCGSIKYFAPEMFQQQEVCPFKADIWALGITFFYMATGYYPFRGESRKELKKSIMFGEIDFSKCKIDSRIRYLIFKMTNMNPKMRPSAEKLLKLPMFSSLLDDKKLSHALGINHRKSFPQEYHRRMHITPHKSLTFHTDLSDSSNNDAAPLTKLHTFKSSSISPLMQRISCHFNPVNDNM